MGQEKARKQQNQATRESALGAKDKFARSQMPTPPPAAPTWADLVRNSALGRARAMACAAFALERAVLRTMEENEPKREPAPNPFLLDAILMELERAIPQKMAYPQEMAYR
jgi:hypothetical protein